MQIFKQLDDVPARFGSSVVSVGNFDGVHLAHLRVLDEIVVRARKQGAKSVVVTFEPHPMRILRPDSGLKLLTPTTERLRLLEKTGIDAVLLLPFTRDVSLMSPQEFARQILCDRLHAVEVHEGYNFHFGHKAAGDVQLLTELGRELGFEVVVYPELQVRGESVSSTRIRELICVRGRGDGAGLAGAAVWDSFYAGAGTWVWGEVHGADHQSEPLRRTGAQGWRLHHPDSGRHGVL